ncbi:DIE2/ALG10 family protein [Tanacetum coccineum]
MVDDMLKAQSKVIDILCNLELIYPPAFFDIMIHLVIHLPLEAIFGGPIRPRWMYTFERYMKKLKNYVRNKAKPEGSIAEGYVAEEALTFSSHYFQDVTTKFNRPDRNVDCPPPTPEIDMYRAKFNSEFPNKDMKEEFPGWFGKQINLDLLYVDAPPNIIDVVDEDDDIIDEEDPIPYDLADFDDEDVVNLDIDDGVNVVYSNVARGHGGDGGGDDRPPPHQIPTGCGGCLGNRGKGTRKPNLDGRRAGSLHTRQETRNLGLKAIKDKSGPVSIRFEVNDRETLMPLSNHAAHWANYLGELVRKLPLHYPSWRQMPPERKAGVMEKIGVTAPAKDLQWKKAALLKIDIVPERTRTYGPGAPQYADIHSYISEVDWDAQLAFWNDPKNLARAVQNKQNLAKSKVGSRAPTPHGLWPYTEDEFMGHCSRGQAAGAHSRSNNKFSQMLNQLESRPEYGGGSGSGGCGDDEPGDDEDGGKDEEDEDDS